MRHRNQFTIYDKLEKDGYFEANPANTFARDPTTGESIYKGPIEYPKMLYHPEGEQRITVPAEVISTPLGPKEVGEQKELIYQVVNNSAEEQALRAEGWHDHAAKAVAKRVELYIEANPHLSEKEKSKLKLSIPTITSSDRIKALEAELARLTGLKSIEENAVTAAPTGTLQPLATANALGAKFGAQASN